MHVTSPSSSYTAQQAQNLRRICSIFIGLVGLTIPMYLYLYVTVGGWQLLTLNICFAVTLGLNSSLIYLSKRNVIDVKASIVLLGWTYIMLSIVSILIIGISYPLAFVSLFLPGYIALHTMPRRWVQPTIGVGLGVALVIIGYGLFGPPVGITVPLVDSFALISSVLIGAGFSILVLRDFKNFQLRNKLLLVFVGVALIPIAIIAVVEIQSANAALIASGQTSLRIAASQTGRDIEDFLETARNDVALVAQFPALIEYLELPINSRAGSPVEDEARRFLLAARRKDPNHLVSYAFLDENGTVLLDTQADNPGQNEASQVYFQQAVRTGTAYISPISFANSEPLIYFSSPVRNQAGQLLGVVRSSYKAAVLQTIVEGTVNQVSADSFASVVDENGLRLAHATNPANNFTLLVPLDSARASALQAAGRLPQGPLLVPEGEFSRLQEALARTGNGEVFTADINGDHAGDDEDGADYYAVATLEQQPWKVLYHQGADVFLSSVSALEQRIVVITLGILVVVAGLAVFAARQLTEPINRLILVSQKITSGDLTAQAEVGAQDEIGVLATSFNTMTAQLRTTLLGLEQRSRAIETSSQVSRRLSTILDPQQLAVEVVEQLRSAFNYYHAHIYLFNETRDELVMVGGTGRAGRTMLANQHRIPQGRGLVGQAAASKVAVLVPDVAQAAGWLPNPLLPDTKAEIAVPIMLADTVLGVLDVQHNVLNGLNSYDQALIQSIADQVAVGLENARSFSRMIATQETLRLRDRAISASNDGIVITDPNQHDAPILYVNEAFERITGYSAAEVIGRNCRFLQGDNTEQPELKRLRLALRAQQPCRVVLRNYRKDGTLFWNELDVSPVYDDTGKLINFIGVQQDVTDRIQAEQALQEALTLQSTVLNSANYMIIATDTAGTIITFNAAAEQNLGYSSAEIVNLASPAMFHDLAEVVAHAQTLSAQLDTLIEPGFEVFVAKSRLGIVEEREWTYTRKDGSRFPVLLSITALLNVAGEITGFLGIANDITERKRAAAEREQLLEEVQHLALELETVAKVGAAATSILDADELLQTVVDLTKLSFNLYHAHIYLFDPASATLRLAVGAGAIGQQMVAEGRTIPLSREQSLVAQAARTLSPVVENNVHHNPAFLNHPLLPDTCSEMAIPLVVGGRLWGVLDVQSERVAAFSPQDVQIQSTLAAQIAVALQNATLYAEQAATVNRLQELDQLKSGFLATMSHELRTPLNSILGFTEVILEGINGPINALVENDLSIIHRNGRHLLNLINDILDMAKIESGKLSLHLEEFDLAEVVSEVAATLSPLASQKALDLHVLAAGQAPLLLTADRFRVRQIMLNLVGNAIKFTDAGAVSIAFESTPTTRVIHIHDTGIGIPAGSMAAIFNEFQQVDNTSTRKSGGTGLGLPISRHLVELHGGSLRVSSSGQAGAGATFTIELPIESSTAAAGMRDQLLHAALN